MANPLEIVKKHPIATGVVIVVVVGAVLLFSGGDSTATYADSGGGYDPNGELSAAAAMQQVQAQLSARSMELQAQKEVALNEQATQIELAKLAKDAAITTGSWAYQIEESRIAAQEREGTLINTLTANLREKELANEAAQTTAQFATIQAQSAALLESQKLNSQTQLNIVKEQNKPRGLFSFLFG